MALCQSSKHNNLANPPSKIILAVLYGFAVRVRDRDRIIKGFYCAPRFPSLGSVEPYNRISSSRIKAIHKGGGTLAHMYNY